MVRGIFLNVRARRSMKDVREQRRRAAVVVEDTSWLGGHRTIDGVLRPISALLESRGGVVRIRIGQVLVPVEAGRHREEMTHRYAPLARVDVGNL